MQSWDALAAELATDGFTAIALLELFCPSCGDWRGDCLADSEFRPLCPRCGEICEVAMLGRGLTRNPGTPWRLASPALSARAKAAAAARSYEGTSGHVKVMDRPDRRRCAKMYERARAEIAALKAMRSAPKATRSEMALRTTVAPAMLPKPRAPLATPEEMKRRIALIAEMVGQNLRPKQIAEKVGITRGYANVLIHRIRFPRRVTPYPLEEKIGAAAAKLGLFRRASSSFRPRWLPSSDRLRIPT